MSVTKLNSVNHRRFIDPYAQIFPDDLINQQISLATNTYNKEVIVSGLEVQQQDPKHFTITKGICIIDNSVIEITNDVNIDLDTTSFSLNSTNYIVIRYKYNLVFNPTKAEIDVVPALLPVTYKYLILGFADIDVNGQISQIKYSNNNESRSPTNSSKILDFVTTPQTFLIETSINVNDNVIKNLADGTNPLDLVNLSQLNSEYTSNDYRVLIDENDSKDYLENKVIAGDKMIRIINNHKISFEAEDNMCRVESADSNFNKIFTRRKVNDNT